MSETTLERIAKGDPSAVDDCLDRYRGLVWSIARRMCSNSGDAEDAAQEIFVDVWRSAARFDPEAGSEATFIALLARRRLIDLHRRAQRRPVLRRLPSEENVEVATVSTERLEIEDEASRVTEALGRLDANRREVLQLSLRDGLTHEGIAERLGVPLGTVKSQARRGLIQVREMLSVPRAEGERLMMPPLDTGDDRFQELLAGRALGDLTAAEERELDQRLASGARGDLESLEEVAAVLTIHWMSSDEIPMPDDLFERIKREGRALVTAAEVASITDSPASSAATVAPVSTTWGAVGWVVAAAALFMAIAGWWPRPDGESTAIELASAPDVIAVDWQPGPDAVGAGVGGRVVWSNGRQRGEMIFDGLPVNDPTEYQYQLWIFDRNQDEATPIDGGVFDVVAGGEVRVPIDAKLTVDDPYLFAITVEKPGGVVVSSRERLALVAPTS